MPFYVDSMANDLSTRVWYIDTPSASILYPWTTRIKFVEVVGTSAGSLGGTMADVRDQNNHPILTSYFQTTNPGELQTFNLESWYNGIIVAALGSGVTLRVHQK